MPTYAPIKIVNLRIYMEKEKVKKIFARIGFGVSVFLNVIFVSTCVYGCANQDKQANAECDIKEDISFHLDNKKMVSYNDESYTITLNADELNNYTFANLKQCFLNFYADEVEEYPSIIYDDETYSDANSDYEAGTLVYSVGSSIIYFNSSESDEHPYLNIFNYYYSHDLTDFGYPLYLSYVSESLYLSVKSAIQLDIQANSGANPNTDIIYNDNAMTISLPSNVVNETKFKSFYDYVSQDTRYEDIEFVLDSNVYAYSTKYNVTNGEWFVYINSSDDININQEGDYKIDDQGSAFGHYVIIDVSDLGLTAYYRIKSAIEYDILESNYSNDSIFTNLTASVVAFVGSISSGITAITSVFYANGQLTVIGLLSVIVVAITLAYFLFRLIIGLIRMRG